MSGPAEILFSSGQLQALCSVSHKSCEHVEQLQEEEDKRKTPLSVHRDCWASKLNFKGFLLSDSHSPAPSPSAPGPGSSQSLLKGRDPSKPWAVPSSVLP